MHVNAKHGFHGCENGGWILFLFSFSILSQHETGAPHASGRREAGGDGCCFTRQSGHTPRPALPAGRSRSLPGALHLGTAAGPVGS